MDEEPRNHTMYHARTAYPLPPYPQEKNLPGRLQGTGNETNARTNMADAYEGVSRGSLKLKGVADGGVKK